ncbi:MAG: SRPBCC domain-containing protein [Chloroflexota bacterium]|nr:SRPBCC domain-containing protein [Chloroflexota bacterium]
MTAAESTITTDARGVQLERIFDAPAALVWQAWTEAEHFARWYGPEGFTVPTCEFDFRVGGEYSLVMRSPDGWEMRNFGEFKEIVPGERFVATMSADMHDETTLTVEIEDLGDGRTKLTMRQDGWPDPQMAEGAGGGWAQALDKLEATLASSSLQALVIERVFDAPRELVWRAWTDADRLAAWYGPNDFTVPACEIDCRVGGRYAITERTPDGTEIRTTGVFQEIVPLESFVATMEIEPEPGALLRMLLSVTLEDLSDGRTRLTLDHTGWPNNQVPEGADQGWVESFDKLAAELAQAA